MKKFTVRALAILLVVLALLSCCVFAASAEDANDPVRGQTLALVQKTADVVKSGTFTVKLGTDFPGLDVVRNTLVLVVDTSSGQMAVEGDTDWRVLLAESGAQHKLLGGFLNVLLGKKFRLVYTKDTMKLVFPSRRLYLNFPSADYMADFAEIWQAINELAAISNIDPADIATSQETIDGNNYLVANFFNGYNTSFYYLDGQLKRIVFQEETGESVTVMVAQLSASADKKYFSTSWMLPIWLPVSGIM